MTTLEKFNRTIIESIHGLPYDEAIKNELMIGCVIKFKVFCRECEEVCSGYDYCSLGEVKKEIMDSRDEIIPFDYLQDLKIFKNREITIKYIEEVIPYIKGCSLKILGLPITIGRVLTAYERKNGCDLVLKITAGGIVFLAQKINKKSIHIANWKLTKENGQEATSEDQTEETLLKILELFNS